MRSIIILLMLAFAPGVYADMPSLPIWDWWMVYTCEPKDPYSITCGVYFGQDGKYEAFVNGVFRETGTCVVSHDSVYVHIDESPYAERTGVSFSITYSIESNAVLKMTNADMVFWGCINSDALELQAGVVGVKNTPWGGVKNLYRE